MQHIQFGKALLQLHIRYGNSNSDKTDIMKAKLVFFSGVTQGSVLGLSYSIIYHHPLYNTKQLFMIIIVILISTTHELIIYLSRCFNALQFFKPKPKRSTLLQLASLCIFVCA